VSVTAILPQQALFEERIAEAPRWVRWTRLACQSLPRGRFRLLHATKSWRKAAFWATASPDVGAFQFICHLSDAIAREVCFTGRYEPQETFLLQRLLTPGQTFVDVGANWGYFTMLAAARVGSSGRIISIEPHPQILALLKANVVQNGISWATVVEAAIAASQGTKTLNGFDPAGDKWGTSFLTGSHSTDREQSFEVVTARLDDVLDAHGVDRVDLLKMDIEGAEALAIKGMTRGLVSGRYPRILLELHPQLITSHGTTAQDVLSELLQHGYRAWRIDHSPEMTRQAAYASKMELSSFIRPLVSAQPLDNWPHLLLSIDDPFV